MDVEANTLKEELEHAVQDSAALPSTDFSVDATLMVDANARVGSVFVSVTIEQIVRNGLRWGAGQAPCSPPPSSLQSKKSHWDMSCC